jgi:TolB-like protein
VARKRRAARDEGPKVGDVVELDWLDSGTRVRVDSVAEAAAVRCHRATVRGEVAFVDAERIVLWTERYDDDTGTAEAVWRASVTRLEVLKRG